MVVLVPSALFLLSGGYTIYSSIAEFLTSSGAVVNNEGEGFYSIMVSIEKAVTSYLALA